MGVAGQLRAGERRRSRTPRCATTASRGCRWAGWRSSSWAPATRCAAMARIGVADREPNLELTGVTQRSPSHALAHGVQPARVGERLGESARPRALDRRRSLFGRDDGFYYRASRSRALTRARSAWRAQHHVDAVRRAGAERAAENHVLARAGDGQGGVRAEHHDHIVALRGSAHARSSSRSARIRRASGCSTTCGSRRRMATPARTAAWRSTSRRRMASATVRCR